MSALPENRDQLAPREIAELTGFSYHAILRAIHRGDLEAFEPIPGRLRIARTEYERWSQQPRRVREQPSSEHRRRPKRANFAAKLDAIEGGG